jgi:hypothetical protein
MTENDTDIKQDELDIKNAKLTCPCCKQPTLTSPISVPDTTMDHFLSCIVTHSPFFHTYKLFDGRIKVTCTELDEPTKQLSTKVAIDIQDAVLKNLIDEQKGVAAANTVYLMLRIKDITISSTNDTPIIYYPQTVAKEAAAELIKQIELNKTQAEVPTPIDEAILTCYTKVTDPNAVSSVPTSLLAQVQETHSNVYNLLLDAGFDTNFWRGIELA